MHAASATRQERRQAFPTNIVRIACRMLRILSEALAAIRRRTSGRLKYSATLVKPSAPRQVARLFAKCPTGANGAVFALFPLSAAKAN